MSTMNEFLAQHYSTAGATAEIEKTAGEVSDDDKIAVFAKIAKDNGIDLSGESDERLEQLFNATFSEKQAGEMPPQFAKKDEKSDEDKKKDEEKEKKAAAEAEFREKQAAQQRFEESDFCGRVMAHAYVNEMRKIAASVTPAAPEEKVIVTDKTAAPTETLRERLLKLAEFPPKKDEDKKDEKKDDKGDDKDKKEGKSLPPWMKDKEASALNELGAQRAVEMIAAFRTDDDRGYDVKVAAERISAVHTLGIDDDTKIASAADGDAAITIRALEYLERAGYPVNWGG